MQWWVENSGKRSINTDGDTVEPPDDAEPERSARTPVDLELKVNPVIFGGGKVYEVTRGADRVGRIWERAATIDPANKWIWSVMGTRELRRHPALLPSGTAASLEDARAQFEAALLRLI